MEGQQRPSPYTPDYNEKINKLLSEDEARTDLCNKTLNNVTSFKVTGTVKQQAISVVIEKAAAKYTIDMFEVMCTCPSVQLINRDVLNLCVCYCLFRNEWHCVTRT